ncbi:MAG TPA: hypothetical protein VLG71_00595 [Candidatus Limnocylindria bacterium]|nr:hypothetical protein [Candidatus Limnocylindria bacterium]
MSNTKLSATCIAIIYKKIKKIKLRSGCFIAADRSKVIVSTRKH